MPLSSFHTFSTHYKTTRGLVIHFGSVEKEHQSEIDQGNV